MNFHPDTSLHVRPLSAENLQELTQAPLTVDIANATGTYAANRTKFVNIIIPKPQKPRKPRLACLSLSSLSASLNTTLSPKPKPPASLKALNPVNSSTPILKPYGTLNPKS